MQTPRWFHSYDDGPDATQAELEAACQAAHIHAFIAGLLEGYETIVTPRIWL